ncbi:Hpt domain-containing protein [Sphingomonas sp. BIUV-7]|uniref:Hpt domain-containing protein n=1 Tax=Sphingomonas natans TaxID=3063330 RepID=A0ABT8YBX3_9SPHN|nr:Hpt domain-containing protein [Sphingomonas sp. BIUV-7]MDO6415140.1 Hpt domain-containing protein [Sphingomonas sp. BIUV-7]
MHEISSQIVDRDRFSAARSELGESFARILSYYREDGAKAIEEIERAVRDRSAVCLVRPSHTLKGDSLMVGADALALAAEEIEKAARLSIEMHDFPDDVLLKVLELRGLFAQTIAFFDRETAERAPPAPTLAPRRTGGFGRKVVGA